MKILCLRLHFLYHVLFQDQLNYLFLLHFGLSLRQFYWILFYNDNLERSNEWDYNDKLRASRWRLLLGKHNICLISCNANCDLLATQSPSRQWRLNFVPRLHNCRNESSIQQRQFIQQSFSHILKNQEQSWFFSYFLTIGK